MPNALTHTTIVEAQRILSGGYKGLREDLSIIMGWPVSRVSSVAKGKVPSGLRYGSKNSQVQSVVVIAQRLVSARKEEGGEEVVVSMPVAHWWRLSPKIREEIRVSDAVAEGCYRVRVQSHVARVMHLAPKIESE